MTNKHLLEHYFRENIETTTSYESQIFETLVYLTITTYVETISYEIETGLKKSLSTKNKTTKTNQCIFLSYFNEQKKIHGNSPIWVRDIPRDKIAHGLSEAFVEFYKTGKYYLCDYKDRENKTPLIDLLKAGKFDLIGRDNTGNNGTIIGSDGKPMRHNLYFDYISASLFSKKYWIRKLLEHLKSHPDVVDAAIEEVPSYNAYDGSKAIVFEYKVSPELHQNFTDRFGYYSSDCEVRQHVLELLGVEKFKKEEDDDD